MEIQRLNYDNKTSVYIIIYLTVMMLKGKKYTRNTQTISTTFEVIIKSGQNKTKYTQINRLGRQNWRV